MYCQLLETGQECRRTRHVYTWSSENTDKHGCIGMSPRPRQTAAHKPSLLTALPCLELALRCRAARAPKQASHAAYAPCCTIPSPLTPCPATNSSSTLALFTHTTTYLPALLHSLTHTHSLLRTCLPEPLACPPLSRGPERCTPQRSVLTQTHCPTTSHPPACLRAPLAMTPS